MQTTSALYQSLLVLSDTYKEWRIAVNGVVYGQDVIVKEVGSTDKAPFISRPTFLDSPSVGSCYAAQFTCTFLLPSTNIPRMATLVPSFRLRNGNQASEWITKGTFYVDTRSFDKASQTTDLVCYDDMLKTDGEGGKTYAELTQFDEWPQSMAAVVQEICSIVGITLDPRTTINSGDSYMVNYPNDYTMREVLGFIAGAHGGNFVISPERKLYLVPIIGSSSAVTYLELGDLAVSESLSAWSKVIVYYGNEEAFEAGMDTGRELEVEDPWAEQGTANSLLSLVSGVSYQPFTVSVASFDLAAELGDSISFAVGETFYTANIWDIEQSCDATSLAAISAPGETAVDHEYPYVSTSARLMRRMVKLGQPYYGVTISKKHGIEIKRSDGLSEALFNSDVLAMRALIDGVMKDRLFFDVETGDFVFNGRLGADAIFTDSLYAETGDISELTVDRLVTAKKVRRYLLGDTSDDNYVRIQDNYLQFVTASVVSGTALSSNGYVLTNEDNEILISGTQDNPSVTQTHNRYGQALYWQKEPVGHTSDGYPIDEDGKQIYASVNVTDWPVLQYAYTELVKASFSFKQINGLYMPQIIMGAGDENGNSKGYLFKEQTDLLLRYVSSAGKNVDVKLSDSGFVDAMHRRLASCNINRSQGKVMYTVEGDNTTYQLSFSVSDSTVTFTWPDGHTCEVSIS